VGCQGAFLDLEWISRGETKGRRLRASTRDKSLERLRTTVSVVYQRPKSTTVEPVESGAS
jgi:hypothetical protein